MKYLVLLLIALQSYLIHANDEEYKLRQHLFQNYNKYVRPVNKFNDIINISMGLGVQNLESFNQKEETIDINLWVRLNWKDDYLNWDSNHSNLTFLSVDKDYIWVPDIELLNAASLPDIYTLKGGMNLYSDGSIMWSNPAIYKFSCSLELHYFPFDTQRCIMKFSSWNYNNLLLNLKPNSDINKQIDILDEFSHSEWEIVNVNVINYNDSRPCCPNLNFTTNEYSIILKRYPHYYNISMGMTISLVIVNFIIMLIKPNNISRTSTAVFIPLTILALQLTLADKIPVVGYYTLMDYFFLCCFITSMVCSIESGLIYSLLTSKSMLIYKIVNPLFDINKLIKKEDENIKKIKERDEKHETQLIKIKSTSIDDEFDKTSKQLRNRSDSYTEIVKKKIKVIDEITETITDRPKLDIIKTIQYDDISLTLSKKEKLIFNELDHYVRKIDNCFRVFLPMLFFILIGVIFSYNN